MDDDGEREIDEQQQPEAAHAERGAGQQAEGHDIAHARRRQRAREADEKERRRHHRGGKGNVLGVVEHRAIPGAAQAQGECRDQARARTRNQPRGRGGSRDAADPRDRAENMAQRVGIDRNDLGEADRDHVEQAAIEIEVLVGEEIAVGKAAAVIGDDQLAIVVLHAFIVGDRVVAEGEQRDDCDGGQQQAGGDVIGVRRDQRTHRPPRAAAAAPRHAKPASSDR